MKTSNTSITSNTMNNVSQFKVNRLASKRSNSITAPKPVRHVMMLWDDENEGTGMVMTTTDTKDKWINKLSKKAQFVDIELNRNILLEDEFLREFATMSN
jgi:hypothetical protein